MPASGEETDALVIGFAIYGRFPGIPQASGNGRGFGAWVELFSEEIAAIAHTFPAKDYDVP